MFLPIVMKAISFCSQYALAETGCPVLVGASRKSFVWKPLGLSPAEGLEGSLAAAVLAVERGARILRVHDVKETVRAVATCEVPEAAQLNPEVGEDVQTLLNAMLLSVGLRGDRAADAGDDDERIGGFLLHSRIGVGGMGEVWRARRDGEWAALKLIRPELMRYEGARARFQQEARALSSVEHEGIVGVVDFGEDSGVPYLAPASASFAFATTPSCNSTTETSFPTAKRARSSFMERWSPTATSTVNTALPSPRSSTPTGACGTAWAI